MNKIIIVLVVTILLLTTGLGVCIHQLLYVNKRPVASASANVIRGRAPLKISFTGSGFDPDGKIVSYHWDFDDGTTSTQQNPNHTYYWRGRFYVRLTVRDDDGETGVDTLEINILDYQHPVAIASANTTYGKAPFKIFFNGSGFDPDGEIVSYHWDFGDGTTSTQQNIEHTYESIGKFFVYLTVTDNDGMIGVDKLEVNAVENYRPKAYASADVDIGRAPLKVQFRGKGEDRDGVITSYLWEFDDAFLPNNKESVEQNPTHTYWLPGTYVVKFTVTDNDGDTDTAVVKIVVKPSIFVSAYSAVKSFVTFLLYILEFFKSV